MRFAQITLSEPQAAFMADAALLLAAALKQDKEMVSGVVKMINDSVRDNSYDPSVIREVVQIVEAIASACARDGRSFPGGGIMPARSLRATFSHDSASAPTCTGSRVVRSRPPAQSVVLWQSEQ